jgi:metal-responsive CopG/Arc/MetJ family transcriptional regulator
MTTQLAIRLPDDLIRQLDELVPETHSTRSEAVRCAIEVYLYRLACERDAEIYARLPLTEDELAIADDAEVWSSAPPW